MTSPLPSSAEPYWKRIPCQIDAEGLVNPETIVADLIRPKAQAKTNHGQQENHAQTVAARIQWRQLTQVPTRDINDPS